MNNLINGLGIANSFGNPTYIPTTLVKEEIMNNYKYVLYSCGSLTKLDPTSHY